MGMAMKVESVATLRLFHGSRAGEEYIYKTVVQEAGLKPSTTRRRYNRDALFYAGYIYRYWHYLTGESSRAIYRQADENQILRSYGYHTESNELAIADMKNAANRKS